MKGIRVLNRVVFGAAVTFLLLGVFALSNATRRPFLRPCTGSWHTSKAGHFSESEQQRSCVTKATESAEDVVAETGATPPSYVPREETLPSALALIAYKQPFRSPPPVQ